MGKDKLRRFAENKTFPHFFEPSFFELREKGFPLKGKWSDFFQNNNPIVLELGCGKGEYALGLAELEPERNYIGVDIKGARMWRGAKTVQEKGIANVAFLRSRINLLDNHFGPNEVESIWLTFSDPQPRKSRAHHRLSHPRFLDLYRKFVKPGGLIHLKTDSPSLYAFTLETAQEQGLEVVHSSADVYGELVRTADEALRERLMLRTFYESMWLEQGCKIHYLEFKLHGPK